MIRYTTTDDDQEIEIMRITGLNPPTACHLTHLTTPVGLNPLLENDGSCHFINKVYDGLGSFELVIMIKPNNGSFAPLMSFQ